MNSGTSVYSKNGGKLSALTGSTCTYIDETPANHIPMDIALSINKILEMCNEDRMERLIKPFEILNEISAIKNKYGCSGREAVKILRKTITRLYQEGTLQQYLNGGMRKNAGKNN